jgi:hypothetical protein
MMINNNNVLKEDKMNKDYLEKTRVQNLKDALEIIRFELRETNRELCFGSKLIINAVNEDVPNYRDLLKTEKLIERVLVRAGGSSKVPGLKSSSRKDYILSKVGS